MKNKLITEQNNIEKKLSRIKKLINLSEIKGMQKLAGIREEANDKNPSKNNLVKNKLKQYPDLDILDFLKKSIGPSSWPGDEYKNNLNYLIDVYIDELEALSDEDIDEGMIEADIEQYYDGDL